MSVRWIGLTAVVLLAACGRERTESANAGTEGSAATDSAPAASADTVAMAGGDSAASASAARDTAAKQQAQRPAAPTSPAKPAAPTKPAASATPAKPAAPSQDTTAATPSDTGAGQTQTAEVPLRDQYHQAPKDTVDDATYQGWKQYNLNCARCHGEDVLGSTIAPHLVMSLKPDGPINTPEKFTQTVCAGRPEKGMPSWCALGMDPAKIGQIYLYVKGRSEGKIHPGRPAVKPEG